MYKALWEEAEPVSDEELKEVIQLWKSLPNGSWRSLDQGTAIRFMKEMGLAYNSSYFDDCWYSGYNPLRFFIDHLLQKGEIDEDVVEHFKSTFASCRENITKLHKRILATGEFE